MRNKFIYSFFVLLIFIICLSNVTISLNSKYLAKINTKEFLTDSSFHYNQAAKFSWPLFGYYNISSYFGNRISPTSRCIFISFWNWYSSSRAAQIFIVFALGMLFLLDFMEQIGYSIIIENQNIQVIYAHVSPNFMVSKNTNIIQNQKIGTVGPKYIDAIENTKYFDSNRQKDEWSNNRTSSSYNNKKRRHSR